MESSCWNHFIAVLVEDMSELAAEQVVVEAAGEGPICCAKTRGGRTPNVATGGIKLDNSTPKGIMRRNLLNMTPVNLVDVVFGQDTQAARGRSGN